MNHIGIAIGRNINAEKNFALISSAAQIQFHVIRFSELLMLPNESRTLSADLHLDGKDVFDVADIAFRAICDD